MRSPQDEVIYPHRRIDRSVVGGRQDSSLREGQSRSIEKPANKLSRFLYAMYTKTRFVFNHCVCYHFRPAGGVIREISTGKGDQPWNGASPRCLLPIWSGYARLMGEDEAGTLASLRAHREEFIDSTIAEHKRRIVKLMGDGALMEFDSMVAAVEFAVAIQQCIRNFITKRQRRLYLRC